MRGSQRGCSIVPNTGLDSKIIELIKTVLKRHSDVQSAVLFGSRAKGTARPNSDIDLVIFGVGDELAVEEIALELEELPTPYKFDVQSFDAISNSKLREHITRVGIKIYENKSKEDEKF